MAGMSPEEMGLTPEQWNALLDDPLGRTLRGRDFIHLRDFTWHEIYRFFEVARLLKGLQKGGRPHPILRGKTLGMIFTKASTRTRVSFEVGMWQLGGHALFLSAQDLQLRRGETIGDTARVLSRFVDGIMIRTYAHKDVTDLARFADIPVINGLTDFNHPCQVLCDYFTFWERRGELSGRKVAYVGDGNNVAHSLMWGAAKLGMNISVSTPEGYEPRPEVVLEATREAARSGGSVSLSHRPEEVVEGADILYTDVWASMGQEAEHDQRVRAFAGFQVNQQLVRRARPDVMVMHCLPAHRGEEITDEVMDGPNSVVFDQAENRLHGQKAILALLMR